MHCATASAKLFGVSAPDPTQLDFSDAPAKLPKGLLPYHSAIRASGEELSIDVCSQGGFGTNSWRLNTQPNRKSEDVQTNRLHVKALDLGTLWRTCLETIANADGEYPSTEGFDTDETDYQVIGAQYLTDAFDSTKNVEHVACAGDCMGKSDGPTGPGMGCGITDTPGQAKNSNN